MPFILPLSFNLVLKLTGNEESRFEMTLRGGNGEYFIRGGPKGVILGRKMTGRDDHLTYHHGDKFWQVHRKTDGHEQWRLTSELAQAELDSLFVNSVKQLDFSTLVGEGSYLVSINRLRILFKVPELLTNLLMPLVFVLVGTKRESRMKNGRRVEFEVEPRKARHLILRIRAPMGLLERLLRHIPNRIPATIFRHVGGWTRIHPESPRSLKGTTCLLISKDHAGLVWLNGSGAIEYLPASTLVEMYERAERNLPFGRLSELGNWTPDVKVTGMTRTAS